MIYDIVYLRICTLSRLCYRQIENEYFVSGLWVQQKNETKEILYIGFQYNLNGSTSCPSLFFVTPRVYPLQMSSPDLHWV